MGHALDYLEDELVELETNGLLLHPRTLEGPTGARATFDGRDVINLASNNYLGLSNHPRMNRAAADAAERFGAGTGAVRTIAGQMRMHLDLEERFAAFKHADAALLFQSGFTANAGTVAAILRPGRRDRERPVEPRVDHRRRASVEGRDQGVRAPGRRGCRAPPDGDGEARPASAPDHGRRRSRWTATSRRSATS